MDVGHYNCRDYHITPQFTATTITNDRSSLSLGRHESFDELEQLSRSPARLKPKFPFLKLPLELRQQVYSYLLPRTYESNSTLDVIASRSHAGSAEPGRLAKADPCDCTTDIKKSAGARTGNKIPRDSSRIALSPVWQKGNIKLLCVCQKVHNECAHIIYGKNTFSLFITYSAITFRFSWLQSRGLNPSRRYSFLELIPKRYLEMIRRIYVHIEHVDAYTAMIKFNVSGKGLAHGLRQQAWRLVTALQPISCGTDRTTFVSHQLTDIEQYLAKVHIRVVTANQIVDELKMLGKNKGTQKVVEDIDEMLEPFGDFCGVRDAAVLGAVPYRLARDVERRMMSMER